jgi:hypothetical protein
MSHFAKVVDGRVTQVIVAEQNFIDSLPDKDDWIQTSYDTKSGQHINGGTPLRGNYAGIGFTYNKENDVFYETRPVDYLGKSCESWTIGAPTWTWQPPIPWPENAFDMDNPILYLWDETTKTWLEVPKT